MALLGSSIDPSLFSNDYSGFARAGAIQGQAYEKLGEDIRSTAEKAMGAMAGVPTGGGGAGRASGGGGSAGSSGGGGIIGAAADIYGQVKQFKGQQEAFGKSMDYMAKAFPDKAEMFNQAKSAVFDPNANAIQQAAAMNQYQNQFDMIGKMQMQQAQLDMMNQRQQGSPAATAPPATKNFYGQ
jgi:hypothetical protein